MSAFIVGDKTINRIVSWINMTARGHQYQWDFCIKPLEKLGYILDTELGCKRLAEDMFTLNCDAVEQRYREGEAEKFRPLNFTYGFCLSEIQNIYQVIKSLKCFLYQCSEGDIFDSTLFKALEKVADNICYAIVSNSKKYEACSWA